MHRTPLLLTLTLTACVSTTGGERITFEAEVVPAVAATPGADGPVITWTDEGTGFEITLTEAILHTGPLYLWSDIPYQNPDAFASLTSWLIPTAHATDLFNAGFLMGEVTTQTRVDLLQPGPHALGPGVGIAGPSRTGELWLEPVERGDADTVSLTGTATRDDLTVPFTLSATLDETWVDDPAEDDPIPLRRLRGLSWDAQLAEGTTVTLTADPRAWLTGADFATLPDEAPRLDGETHHVIGPDTTVGRTFFLRLRRLGDSGPWSLHATP